MTRAGTRGTAAFPGRSPAVLGHRGLGCGTVSGHRENTLGSFTAAVRLGVTWVEADVRRTRDDVLVVEHDAVYPDGTALTASCSTTRTSSRVRRADRKSPRLNSSHPSLSDAAF